jgi:hypothetical protein
MDDLYWCHEGCGFVKKDHRCEQWSCVSMIPGAAVAKLEAERDEWQDKAIRRNLEIDSVKRESYKLRDSLREMLAYAIGFSKVSSICASNDESVETMEVDIAKAKELLNKETK